MKSRLLWITDPWDTLDHANDTTLRIAQAALAQGIDCFWCDVKTLRWDQTRVVADISRIVSIGDARGPEDFELTPPQPEDPAVYERLLYRTDPPVDLAYLHPLQLLQLAVELKRAQGPCAAEIVSPADLLFSANEKLDGAHLPSLMPATLAASRWDNLEAFGRAEGLTILKPLFEAQSKGVALLDWRTSEGIDHARTIIQKSTDDFQRPVLLQRYLEKIKQGEQRLWFLNGKLIGQARKVPKSGESIINMDLGGSVVPTQLTDGEKAAALMIGDYLRERKVRMAAVDLIDGLVTDFNFTSPGLIIHLEKAMGLDLATPIAASLAQPWA